MRSLSLSATAILVASFALPSAGAQDPPRAVDLGSVLRGAHGVTDAAGQLLAIGGGVEAAFEAGHVVLTPLLGRTAPRNMPLNMRFDRILRGDRTVITIAPGANPSGAGTRSHTNTTSASSSATSRALTASSRAS